MFRFNEEQCSFKNFGPVKQLGKCLDNCRLRGANMSNICIQYKTSRLRKPRNCISTEALNTTQYVIFQSNNILYSITLWVRQ